MLLQSPTSTFPSDPLGTASPSPSPPTLPQAADLFSDIFSSSPSPPLDTSEHSHTNADTGNTPSSSEPSDVPRLRATHVTAGYREGIAAAKASSLQGGFDEGYSLGAVMGLRIGQILGVLEGLSKALETAFRNAKKSGQNQGVEGGVDIETLNREASEHSVLFLRAKEDLAVGKVFGRDYWNEDGTWSYEVEPRTGGEEPLFEDVVSSHPLVREWESQVSALMQRFGIDKGRWDGKEWEEGRVQEENVGQSA